MKPERVRCLIIGSGPAGYTAAIYAARANLSPLLYEGITPGGQLTTTTHIDNFPGYVDGVTGPDMMDDMKRQAMKYGADVRSGIATEVNFSKRPFKVTIDDKHMIEADSVIIATGATAKYLGLASETRLRGSGVSACATCDGFFYKERIVAVVGGGDTACESALYLSSLAKKVYIIVRKDHMRASKVMQNRVAKTTNIELLYEHNTKEVLGSEEGGVTGVLLEDSSGAEKIVKIDGFFLAIGHHPNTELFVDYLQLDDVGYIITTPGRSTTNIPGVFAAGDVQDSNYRQAITAAGSGCKAAMDCEYFLMTEGEGELS